ncbi:MAG: DUF2163 domain-containing protein [Pseudomonadota bacterium]
MTGISTALQAHLNGGATTLCRAWRITRQDGVEFAFTDHDMPLSFDDVTYRADAGLSAQALAQTTGLAVDNTEALGALSHASIREDELEQGRFDGAEVRVWLINWADLSQRWLQFRGSIGQITRVDGAFRAELRGLTEALNKPTGRVYSKSCTAVWGQGGGISPAFTKTLAVDQESGGRIFLWPDLPGFEVGFFERGRLDVIDGTGAGLWSAIKHDRIKNGARQIELWEPIKADVPTGINVKLTASCCQQLGVGADGFENMINHSGFPDLPGEDWLVAVPKQSGANTGGSLR